MIVSGRKLPSVCVSCLKIFIFAIFYCVIEPFFKRYLLKIQFNLKYKGPETAYHTVSIKKTWFGIFAKISIKRTVRS